MIQEAVVILENVHRNPENNRNTGEVTLNHARRQANRMGALDKPQLLRTKPMCGIQKHLIFLQRQATENRSQTLNACPVCAYEGRLQEMGLKGRTGPVNMSCQQVDVYYTCWQGGSGTKGFLA